MDSSLRHLLDMSVSKLMEQDRMDVLQLCGEVRNQLLSLDIQEWDVERYICWNSVVEGWCVNLWEIVEHLKHVQMIIAKKRCNTSDSEDHIDGI